MPSEKKKRVLPPPAGLDFVTPPKDSLVDDLRYALEHAKELYSDIAWDFTLASSPTIIYAHKGIILFPLLFTTPPFGDKWPVQWLENSKTSDSEL